MTDPPGPLLVVMGVSGSGKSTVGARLAGRLGCGFVDGDDLHPPANVAKMASGDPLTDADRRPWLAAVGGRLATAGRSGTGLVVACSALRREHRDTLRAAAPTVSFVHLEGSRELVAARQGSRPGHFMPSSLLDSQFQTLEPLAADEPGFAVPIDADVDAIVDDIVSRLGRVTS